LAILEQKLAEELHNHQKGVNPTALITKSIQAAEHQQ
jgi:hypothetical protein